MSPLDAAGLVRRIVSGEEGAEAELVEQCGGTLRFLCRRFTRTPADGEDLYQETLMLAIEKIRHGEVKEPERLAGFLRALAKNLATQRYRRHRYKVERPTDTPPDTADERGTDALGGLLRSERNRLTRRLLAELDVPRDRDVLLRYYFGEESSATICADLDLAPDHFYRVIHRARQRFRRLWEKRLAITEISA